METTWYENSIKFQARLKFLACKNMHWILLSYHRMFQTVTGDSTLCLNNFRRGSSCLGGMEGGNPLRASVSSCECVSRKDRL